MWTKDGKLKIDPVSLYIPQPTDAERHVPMWADPVTAAQHDQEQAERRKKQNAADANSNQSTRLIEIYGNANRQDPPLNRPQPSASKPITFPQIHAYGSAQPSQPQQPTNQPQEKH